MHLSEHVETYIREHDLRNGTAADYSTMARMFTEWSLSVSLETLSTAEATNLLNDWIIHLTGMGLAPSTVRGYRAKVLVLWRDAYRCGVVNTMPDVLRVRRVKVPRSNPEGWTRDDIMRLCEYCEIEPGMRRRLRLVKVQKGLYLSALFRWLFNTGMRLGDALDVSFSDIQGGQIVFRQNKTEVWHRVKLWPSTLRAIDRIRDPQRDRIWWQPSRGHRALYRTIQLTVERAGLKGTTKFARRGGATVVEQEQPGMAPTYLGHVPGSTVAYRHYVDQRLLTRVASPSEL